eukprot:3256692-Lingulodinium_polyedra.AAC.1
MAPLRPRHLAKPSAAQQGGCVWAEAAASRFLNGVLGDQWDFGALHSRAVAYQGKAAFIARPMVRVCCLGCRLPDASWRSTRAGARRIRSGRRA